MLLALLFLALIAAAAISDLWSYRIPNVISAGLVVLFLIGGMLAPGPLDWLSHLGAGGLVLAVGFALFAAGGIGAGDVKLMTATALWFGLDQLVAHMVLTALAGLVLLTLILPSRWLLPRLRASGSGGPRTLPRLLRSGAPVPYGVAIAASAALLTFLAPSPLGWA